MLINMKKQKKPIKVDPNANVSTQLSQSKAKKKQNAEFKKKVLSTLDWCNIQEVRNNEVLLKDKSSKTIYHVMGIKVKPHDIFLDDVQTMQNIIEKWRLALNKLPFKIYWGFVTSPVDIDDYKARLYQLNDMEDDRSKKQLLIDDYNKAEWFERTHCELEFMLFIQESDEKLLEKHLTDLIRETKATNFEPKQLLKRDFLNYIAYLFDNKLLNATFFSRGIFHTEVESYYIENNEVKTKALNTDDYLLDENISNVEFATDEAITDFERSKLMPTAFAESWDYMALGEKYVSAILVTEMPSNYYVGLLCQYLNHPNIKVLMTTEMSDLNIQAALKKDRLAKLDEYNKTTDPTRQMMLSQDLQDQQTMLDRYVRNNDKTLNMVLVFLICCDSKEDMYQLRFDTTKSLESEGFQTTNCKLIQEQTLRIVCPMFINGKLPKQTEINIGVPLPAENISGMYPFVFETLKDNEGFLFGEELSNGGVVLFDTFAYKRPYWANRHDHQRTSGSMIIVGKSGFGKSVALNMSVRNDLKEGYNVVAIDPENKIFKLFKKYGGSIINYGTKNNIINQFDLRPISTDEDEEDPNYDRKKAEAEMWDTNNAINFVIGQVNQVFKFLFNEYTDEEAGIMGELIMSAYINKGINPQNMPTFRGIDTEKMPIYSDVKAELDKAFTKDENKSEFRRRILEKLQIKLNRVCGEWGVYLDGHTSLKFNDSDTRKVVAFGTKQLQNVDPKLKTALNHIMYQYAWSLCIDNEQWSTFVLDEAHVNILEGEIASLTSQFVRRARKYNTCVKLATQEPHDFADPSILTHGKAIFNNCCYKLILHLDPDPARDVAQLVTINESELNYIMNFERAQGLFVCGERRLPIRVLATEKELSEF